MQFDLSYDASGLALTPRAKASGLIGRLLRRPAAPRLDNLPRDERNLALAIGDLRALADERPGEVTIAPDRITLTHAAAAELDDAVGALIGLPPFVRLELRTDVEGIVGSPGFRLRYEWRDRGRIVHPRRVGCLLETADGTRRIPGWMLRAIDLADGFTSDRAEADHWEALALFRNALEPELSESGAGTPLAMTEFLSGLSVRLADSFSLSPRDGSDGALDFDPVPFLRSRIDGTVEIGEDDAVIGSAALTAFQNAFARSGALPAYKTGDRSFLVVEPSARVVLDVLARKKRASREERAAFVRNPRPAITRAIEEHLRAQNMLEGLDDAAAQEVIESAAGPALVETREYSQRVVGIVKWTRPDLGLDRSSGTTWLPEAFDQALVARLEGLPRDDLARLKADMDQAYRDGRREIAFQEATLPVNEITLRAIDSRLRKLAEEPAEQEETEEPPADQPPTVAGPLVLETRNNFDEIAWNPDRRRREARLPRTVPETIQTKLKRHQIVSLEWAISAWAEGLPGILNADEQGLGKTLQTLAFLVWLRKNADLLPDDARKPLLVVAPTSLLRNWEAEASIHLAGDGLGELLPLYGGSLARFRKDGARGRDTEDGTEKLDLDPLERAIAMGRGNRYWVLTTYTTLTNYQHSFARIPFACAVFDEIQALKNPTTLSAAAARAMNADFRIGLTGTPIENRTTDLWAIMDQLAPGALGDLRSFRQEFGTPHEDNMSRLHGLVFREQKDATGQPVPPLAIRRLKDEVARDLPPKRRLLHPRIMPERQAQVYDLARLRTTEGRTALEALHHIRSVSVHPAIDDTSAPESFIADSARLRATFEILDRIHGDGERALVFIESIRMQHRFAELARQRYGLNRIDIINGSTPIPQRQAIVKRFQSNLGHGPRFDLLILGPKAAGTGLTLTAATHVIHLSRWWNPAVEEQCNDRVHRIGQTRPVHIHVPMAIHPAFRESSFDCLLHSLMCRKRRLASSALWPMGDEEGDVATLRQGLEDAARTDGNAEADPLAAAIRRMFERDGIPVPDAGPDGSYPFS